MDNASVPTGAGSGSRLTNALLALVAVLLAALVVMQATGLHVQARIERQPAPCREADPLDCLGR